jgi:two-component system CheB/CheR fusion protein
LFVPLDPSLRIFRRSTTSRRRLPLDDLLVAGAGLTAGVDELRRENVDLNEKLATANEEVDTIREELETSGRELQSTNQELRAMNEEIQTVNAELRQRGVELRDLNVYFDAILASFASGVAVVDKDLLVRAWNHEMEDLWGVRRDEVEGKHLQNLDIGLPVDEVRGIVRTCLAQDAQVEKTVDATNRRGRAIKCRVAATPLRGETKHSVILVVEDTTK